MSTLRRTMRPLHFLATISFITVVVSSCTAAPQYGPENGALVIVGGGRVGEDVWGRFLELAGGASEARLIVVPTAGGSEEYDEERVVSTWRNRGVEQVKMLHTIDPEVADTEDFVKDLREATAVWFNGGRQWRLTDAYLNTLTFQEFHNVLSRGGVIGGSSAGATIQGSYLARGAPEGNQIMMSPGHEESFGFLKNSAIDQHIDARGRWTDLYEVIVAHPELLGIGISEGTAVVVTGDIFEVIGPGKVAIHDARRTFAYGDTVHYSVLEPGEWFDIVSRVKIDKPENR
ncbi:cyanophycinase [Candidatus Zixiibacteriota bacterium]